MGEDVEEWAIAPLVITATGYELPQNQTSNDITIITKEEIAHLPVHDVADVLNYVNGLSVDRGGGPGTVSSLSVQGSNFSHVKVMIDGVPIESLSSSFPDTSFLDLHSVERIEILKGAASSVWGSSIGGVINIITRQPSEEFISEVAVSVGENSTNRFQASLSGTEGVGYFISVKRFETDGFSDYQRVRNSNFYGKVTKEVTPRLKVEGSYEYVDINREDSGWLAEEDTVDRRGRIKLLYSANKDMEITLDGYFRKMDFSLTDDMGDEFLVDNEETYGGGLMSVWRHSSEGTLSLGLEADRGEIVDYKYFSSEPGHSVNKEAVYASEALTMGDMTMNVGARYDSDSIYGSEVSPSAGVVYRAGRDTLLRLNAARGFTPPPVTNRYWGSSPNNELNAERAWTYQASLEHKLFNALGSKLSFYRADVTDGVVCDSVSCQNVSRMKRQGVELDLKTKEYHGATFSYGYAFNDVRDEASDEIIDGYVRSSQNVGLAYRGPFETRLTLKGNYVYWHADDAYNAKDRNFLWDVKVSKYMTKWKSVIGEFFLSVHNITDEDQYWIDIYPNAGRWIEGGITLTTY